MDKTDTIAQLQGKLSEKQKSQLRTKPKEQKPPEPVEEAPATKVVGYVAYTKAKGLYIQYVHSREVIGEITMDPKTEKLECRTVVA